MARFVVTSQSLGFPVEYLTSLKQGAPTFSQKASDAKVFKTRELALDAQGKVKKSGKAPHKDYILVHNLDLLGL